MEEIWKPIPGYENRYEASSLGNIRSIKRYSKQNAPETDSFLSCQ